MVQSIVLVNDEKNGTFATMSTHFTRLTQNKGTFDAAQF